MDLLLIPILLSLGGGLIYLSLHGAPKVSFEKVPFSFKREPFKLNDWMTRRPNSRRVNRISAEDAELVDLMNDMIAVREQLTDLRLARAPRPIRRRQGRKPATTPVVKVELSVAVEEPLAPPPAAVVHVVEEATPAVEEKPVRVQSSKLPQPVKAASELPTLSKDLLEKDLLKKSTTTPIAVKKPAPPKPEQVEKQAPTRRPSYTSHNRRYVRT